MATHSHSDSVELPTSTVCQARLRIFQPTRRPRQIDTVIVTSWGRARIVGRLGQQHADVFEAICYTAREAIRTADGRVKLLVDPSLVRRVARQPSGTTFLNIRDDLVLALIEIVEPAHLSCVGHLIDHIESAQRADGSYITAENPLGGRRRPKGRMGGHAAERHLWCVDVGKAALKLFSADLLLHHNPAPIAALRHGISQAVARHYLSHRAGTCAAWRLDTWIRAVAGDIAAQDLWERRQELMADAGHLAAMGVTLGVDQKPVGIDQKPGGIDQKPGGIDPKPGGIDQKPGMAGSLQDIQGLSGP